MDLPVLPAQFSGAARRSVVNAWIIAGRKFKLPGQVILFTAHIVAAFAHEACLLGNEGAWHSDDIDLHVRNFTRQLLSELQAEYHDMGIERMTNSVDGSILPAIWRQIEGTVEWKTYQDELLAVGSVAPEPKPAQPSGRTGYRQEIYAWMKREGIEGLDRAARRLSVSKSALKSIMSDKGKARYGPELLKRILETIGYQPKG